MKSTCFTFTFLIAGLTVFTARAQDSAGPTAAASTDASALSGHSAQALVAAASSGIHAGSGAAAVPAWMLGKASTAIGTATAHAGQALWDASQRNCGVRPALNHEVGVPAPAPVAPHSDPSPAAAMDLPGAR